MAHLLVQRCIDYKESNLFGYLRKGDRAEVASFWRHLHLPQVEAAERESLENLQAFGPTMTYAGAQPPPLHVESDFNRIKGHDKLPQLLVDLAQHR